VQTTPDNRYVVPWPPAIWYSPASGKTYAGSGGTHIEIDPDWTLDDVQEFFCWGNEARKYWDSNHSDDVTKKSIEVKGSKGKKYTVTQIGSQWECECTGYRYRRDCKHIENLKILLAA